MQKTTTITSEKEDHIESKKDHSHRICKGRDIESEKDHRNYREKYHNSSHKKRPVPSQWKKTTTFRVEKDHSHWIYKGHDIEIKKSTTIR